MENLKSSRSIDLTVVNRHFQLTVFTESPKQHYQYGSIGL